MTLVSRLRPRARFREGSRALRPRARFRDGSRALDVFLVLTAAVGFAPVLGLASLLIVLDDGGTPLFIQERVGRGGRSLRVVKLRTMGPGGAVTRVGKWHCGKLERLYARRRTLVSDVVLLGLSVAINVVVRTTVRRWLGSKPAAVSHDATKATA